jgi:hypothetical protein
VKETTAGGKRGKNHPPSSIGFRLLYNITIANDCTFPFIFPPLFSPLSYLRPIITYNDQEERKKRVKALGESLLPKLKGKSYHELKEEYLRNCEVQQFQTNQGMSSTSSIGSGAASGRTTRN